MPIAVSDLVSTDLPPLKLGHGFKFVDLSLKTEDRALVVSSAILDIISQYRLTKAADSHDKWIEGTPKFLQSIENYVRAGQTVRMCLPGFPFKSANKQFKVLGALPDKAEEVALARLNAICSQIGEIYKPGAKLLIISDGLVYNGRC